MRRLIISNTHYQTIFAIQMRATIFKDDKVVLLISDHSKNSDVFCANLADLHFFDEVHYIFSRSMVYNYSPLDAWQDAFSFAFLKTNRYFSYLKDINNLYFDELIIYNYEADIYGLYSILSNVNRNIKISMFEEGITSYGIAETRTKALEFACKQRHKRKLKTVFDAIGNFYCFYPHLYKGNYTPVKIKQVNQHGQSAEVIKRTFGVDKATLDYKEKYIFFTSVYDFEGEPIGETELVMHVANTVGRENLLVKVHPRDRRDVFNNSGLKIDQNSAIPWEAIQLTTDFSDKKFVTATSNSVLAGSFLSPNPVQAYYLFKLCDVSKNKGAIRSVESIEHLLKDSDLSDIFSSIKIVKGINDIL